MKNSQAPIWKHTIDNMEIVSAQVPTEQLINIIKSALTSDLEIPAIPKNKKTGTIRSTGLLNFKSGGGLLFSLTLRDFKSAI